MVLKECQNAQMFFLQKLDLSDDSFVRLIEETANDELPTTDIQATQTVRTLALSMLIVQT